MMNFSPADLTAKAVEMKGQAMYKLGYKGMMLGLIGFCILFLHCLIKFSVWGGDFGEVVALLGFDVYYDIEYVFLAIAYLGILVGIASIGVYFHGINLYALGRTAVNTEKE